MAAKPRRKPTTDDTGPNCPRKVEFIEAALAKRGLTLAKSWPKPQGKPQQPARPIPGPEAA